MNDVSGSEIRVESIENCARCGGDHQDMTFKRLSRPSGRYTHWATCPISGEPILMFAELVGSVPPAAAKGVCDEIDS